jgi:hypothetical protein
MKKIPHTNIVDITWQKFNYLLVESFSHTAKVWPNKRSFRNCICECWSKTVTESSNLKRWYTQSCWCKRKENNIIHWMKDTKFYTVYQNIKQRCNNKNLPQYKDWWGRWIKCERPTFLDFKNDMYESYQQHYQQHGWMNTKIERLDNNWNYSKLNCTRATSKEQAQNRRKKGKMSTPI